MCPEATNLIHDFSVGPHVFSAVRHCAVPWLSSLPRSSHARTKSAKPEQEVLQMEVETAIDSELRALHFG